MRNHPLIEKVILSLIAVGMVYFMTKVAKWMIEWVADFHKEHNAENIERQPVKFFVSNTDRIASVAGYFYWGGLILMLFGIWFGK